MKIKNLLILCALSLASSVVVPRVAHSVVSDTDTKTVTALGNGVTTNYTIGFDFRSNSDLLVVEQDESTTPYTRTTIAQGAGASKYTVTGGNPGTAVVMGTAPSSTQRLVITRDLSITQSVDYAETEAFPAEDHEEQMDKMTLLLQDLNAHIDAKIGLAESSTSPNPTFPDAIADTFIVWNHAAGDLTIAGASAVSGDVLKFNGTSWAKYALDTKLAQIDASLALLSPIATPTFTGTVTMPNLILSGLTASTVPYLDATKQMTSSTVTPFELSTLSGVTANLQSQLNALQTAPLTDGKIWIGNGSNVAQARTVSGDLTISNVGSATIGSGKVLNSMLADVATSTFKGRTSGGTGSPQDLTVTQATALLNSVVGDSGSGGTKGLVPAPSAGDAAAAKFLKADGTWAAPGGAGLGDVAGPASSVDSEITLFSGTGGKTIKRATGSGIAHVASGVYSASNIVNADVDAAAAIDDTKLNTISTAGKVSNSATTATSANTASAIAARDASGNISGSDPTSAAHLATKSYVDTQLSYLNPAESVFAASTANITGTYTNLVSGVCIPDTFVVTATGALSLDGTSPAVGARILLKNQTNTYEDGVWTVTVAGSVGVSPSFTRALDFNSSADINAGSIIPIINGTVNAGASYFQTATNTTCNSSTQTWTQFQKAASAYLAVANNLSDVASASTARNNILPSQGGNSGKYLTTDGSAASWGTVSGSGTVTSVAQTVPTQFSIGGSPVTTSGTLAITLNSTPVSKTSTYTVVTTDFALVASGASFTFTLPAATNKMRLRFIHNDSDLSRQYTISRAGSDTIGRLAATSTKIATQGEVLELESDGTSVWEIISRSYPQKWVAYTSTTQGFGTVSSAEYEWMRQGSNCKVRGKFTAGTIAASEARVGIPGGLAITETSTRVGGEIWRNNLQWDYMLLLAADTLSYFTVSFVVAAGTSAGGGQFTAQTATAEFNNSDVIQFTGDVSISGWE